MLKKILIIAFIFSLVSFTNVNASVRDPENLITAPWTHTKQGFGGETLTTFFNGSQTSGITNDLITADGRKADYLQIFFPYHPNLGLQVFPANDGTNAQASIIYFNTGGTFGTPFQMTNLFATNTTTSSIRRTNGGYSTVIEVPRNAQNFYVVLYANTENGSTVDEIEDLLDEQFSVQLVANPNNISYPFNDFAYFSPAGGFEYIRSLDNLIPATAVNEMIIYINNFYDYFYDTVSINSFLSLYKGSTFLGSVNLKDAQYANPGLERDGYYVFDLNTTFFSTADNFDIHIRINSTTGLTPLLENMTNSMYYNFDDQIHDAYYYNGLQLIDKRPFSLYVFDLENTLLPNGHNYWNYTNPETNEIDIFNFSSIPNQDVYLYSAKTTVISPQQVLPGSLGGVNSSFDTILTNTGFFNAPGMMLLYFIVILSIGILIWQLKFSSLVAIMLNILMTALFMILGYLPLFVSILLITFYIIAIIGINKGGLFSE